MKGKKVKFSQFSKGMKVCTYLSGLCSVCGISTSILRRYVSITNLWIVSASTIAIGLILLLVVMFHALYKCYE